MIEVEPAAEAELEEAAAYLEERRPTAGDRLLRAFDATIRRILEFPDAWPPFSRAQRRCRVDGFPYWVVYEWNAEVLRIVAVAHEAREPGYWRGRRGPEAGS